MTAEQRRESKRQEKESIRLERMARACFRDGYSRAFVGVWWMGVTEVPSWRKLPSFFCCFTPPCVCGKEEQIDRHVHKLWVSPEMSVSSLCCPPLLPRRLWDAGARSGARGFHPQRQQGCVPAVAVCVR